MEDRSRQKEGLAPPNYATKNRNEKVKKELVEKGRRGDYSCQTRKGPGNLFLTSTDTREKNLPVAETQRQMKGGGGPLGRYKGDRPTMAGKEWESRTQNSESPKPTHRGIIW